MSTIVVRTQADLDAALREHGSDPYAVIEIGSPRGDWLSISEAVAATVEAGGSATVEAWGSATVRAGGSATVEAGGSATVRAGSHVAVHRQSQRATISGGVVIDHADIDLTSPQAWVDYTAAEVTDDGRVLLYKAVDQDLNAGHHYRLTNYALGSEVTAPDWHDDNHCGGGLHASPHPGQALSYCSRAKRMLVVSAPLSDIRSIGNDKAKVQTFRVEREVTLSGRELVEVAA